MLNKGSQPENRVTCLSFKKLKSRKGPMPARKLLNTRNVFLNTPLRKNSHPSRCLSVLEQCRKKIFSSGTTPVHSVTVDDRQVKKAGRDKRYKKVYFIFLVRLYY